MIPIVATSKWLRILFEPYASSGIAASIATLADVCIEAY